MRHRASFSGVLDGGDIAWTRDVSPAGVFLFAPGHRVFATGDAIGIRLRLDELDPARPAWIRGLGRIVRVEPGAESIGLAIRVDEWSTSVPPDTS